MSAYEHGYEDMCVRCDPFVPRHCSEAELDRLQAYTEEWPKQSREKLRKDSWGPAWVGLEASACGTPDAAMWRLGATVFGGAESLGRQFSRSNEAKIAELADGH